MAQLKTTYQSTKPLDLTVRCRSLYKHSAEEEGRPTGKSSMGTDPSEHEHDLCRAEYNARSRKLNACDRDTRLRNNFLYNNLICPSTMPHKGASTQCHNQQVLAKPRHNPSDRDQQVREKLQQKVKISVYTTCRRDITNRTYNIPTRSTSYFTFTSFSRWIIKFKINCNPYPVCNTRRLKLFRNHRLLLQ